MRKLAFIDWHTGLGEPGQPFFSASTQRAIRAGSVPAAGGDAIASNRSGGYAAPNDHAAAASSSTAYSASSAPAEMTGAVIEFGTLPVAQAFEQLARRSLAEVRRHPGDDPRRLARLRSGVGDAFTPPDPAWRRGVVGHATEIQLRGLAGLAAW